MQPQQCESPKLQKTRKEREFKTIRIKNSMNKNRVKDLYKDTYFKGA